MVIHKFQTVCVEVFMWLQMESSGLWNKPQSRLFWFCLPPLMNGFVRPICSTLFPTFTAVIKTYCISPFIWITKYWNCKLFKNMMRTELLVCLFYHTIVFLLLYWFPICLQNNWDYEVGFGFITNIIYMLACLSAHIHHARSKLEWLRQPLFSWLSHFLCLNK